MKHAYSRAICRFLQSYGSGLTPNGTYLASADDGESRHKSAMTDPQVETLEVSRSFRVLRKVPGGKSALVCLHGAGAGASTFAGWGRLVPAQVSVWAAQLPGREDRLRERPLRSVHEIAAMLAAELADSRLERIALVGHSLGALLAFELCRLLVRKDRGPVVAGLSVAARAAPDEPVLSRSHLLPDGALIDELRQWGGTPEAVLRSPALLRVVLDVIRADFEAAETYHHQDGLPLAVPIQAWAGSKDPFIRPEKVRGWARHTSVPLRYSVCEGGHFFLRAHAPAVVAAIVAEL